MAYVITEPCIGTKDKSCVDVCPVDCIHGKDDDEMLFIDPEVCIDCGAAFRRARSKRSLPIPTSPSSIKNTPKSTRSISRKADGEYRHRPSDHQIGILEQRRQCVLLAYRDDTR